MRRDTSTVERQLEAAMQAAEEGARPTVRAALDGVRSPAGDTERKLQAAIRATSNPRATRHVRDALVRFRQVDAAAAGGHASAD